MEPPICSLCHKDQRDHPDLEFGLVRFADYEPIDRPGHPKGLLWFCEDYLDAAKSLEYLPSSEALERLRKQFGK